MLDLHIHIVPTIDDGSTSIEESIYMPKMLQNQGVSTIVSTSHFDFLCKIDEFILKRDSLLEPLSAYKNIKGAEAYYYEGISANHETNSYNR